MHLHPTVARLIIEIGRDYGLRAVRVPAEPVDALRGAFPEERAPMPFFRPWIERLRRRLRRAGLVVNDHIFGLAWSGNMVEPRVLRLLPYLPEGVSEMYFHPAAERSPALIAAMPDYHHVEELDGADECDGSITHRRVRDRACQIIARFRDSAFGCCRRSDLQFVNFYPAQCVTPASVPATVNRSGLRKPAIFKKPRRRFLMFCIRRLSIGTGIRRLLRTDAAKFPSPGHKAVTLSVDAA